MSKISKANNSASAHNVALLDKLQRDFENYRNQRPRGVKHRIPERLREAVAAALREGVSPGRLRAQCRLSSVQVRSWRNTYAPQARILDVVEDPAPKRPEISEPLFELRIGRWRLCLRTN